MAITFISATDSATVTVNDSLHGALVGDFVTFNSANTGNTTLNGQLNTEHEIQTVPTKNTYTITLSANAAAALSSAGSANADYQLNVGINTAVQGTGWGAAPWGGDLNITTLSTTLAEEIEKDETAIDVASATGISNNDVIQVRGELMLVTNVSSNTLTVTRGHGGTTQVNDEAGVGTPATITPNTVRLALGNATVSDDYITLIDGTDLASDTSATTVTVDSTASFESSGFLKIEDEVIQYSGKTSTTFTGLVRGVAGTIAATHANNVAVFEATSGFGVEATEATDTGITLRLWSQDNFGEDLIFNERDGFVFYWDKTLGITSRAKNLIELSDAAPTKSRKVIVSERDRHVLCFGANPIGQTQQDKMLVRFSSQENPFLWTPSVTNTAGDLRIGSGSEIVTAVKTRRETIVLTDTSVHSLQFIGPPFTFGVTQIASAITVRGFNSAVAVGDSVFWMGYDRFYVYDGRVQVLPCTVRDHVFQNFNETQSDKVYAGINSAFGEIFWFYPSATNSGENGGTDENDRYVVYNYDEKVWYVGNLARTSWVDRGVYQYPMATDLNLVYNHEKGNDNDGTAFTSFIESSPLDIQDGDQFVFLRRMIPDVSFAKSDTGIADSTKKTIFSLKAQRSPAGGFVKTFTNNVLSTTELNHLRLRGRSFGLRVESTDKGVNWRLGTPRVDVRADGDR
jgi:hypothetical protein